MTTPSVRDKEAALRHLAEQFRHFSCMPSLIVSTDEQDWDVGTACNMALLIHSRAFIEFLVEPPGGKGMVARDFVPSWAPPVDLPRHLGPINEHLAHLAWKRVRQPSKPFPTQVIADAITNAMADFASSLVAIDQPQGERLAEAVEEGRKRVEGATPRPEL